MPITNATIKSYLPIISIFYFLKQKTMKTIPIKLYIVLLLGIVLTSCNHKKDSDPEPEKDEEDNRHAKTITLPITIPQESSIIYVQ